MSSKAVALTTSIVVIPILVILAIAGYLVLPFLGILGEIALWGYVLAKGNTDPDISGKKVLIVVISTLLIFGIIFGVMYLMGKSV